MVERALRGAPPHGLLDSLRTHLAQHFAATAVDLLLIDYGLSSLRPFGPCDAVRGPVPVEASPAGRVFSEQQPYLSTGAGPTVTAYLPVAVRGDRYGVLVVTLPRSQEPPEVFLDHLGAIAQMLGHALRVAERHTDVYREARRNGPLTLSAEMQWELMPGRSCSREEFDLHAHGEPAYASGGHLFDWSASADQLTLVVANSAGTDAEAGLVNNLALNAIRNARRAGLDLAGQAALADQALYGQHRGTRHLSTLLMCFDLRTGAAQIVDAGSPSVWRVSGPTARRVELERQLPLGMFEDTVYAAQHLRTRPQERLLFVACGPELPASQAAHADFDQAVSRAVTRTRHLPGADTPKAVLRELVAHGAAPDGGLVLSLDLRGPSADGA